MKTAFDFSDPSDPIECYRKEYIRLMTDIATILRKSISLTNR